MKNTWTKTMVFALIGLLLLSATACNKNKDSQTDDSTEQTTDMLQGGMNQGQGDQYNDPSNQGDQPGQNDQGGQNGQQDQNDQQQQTQPVVNIPDDSGNQDQSPNGNNGNTGNTGNQGSSTDSTGLTFTSNGNGTCTLTGLGSCRDICVVIPATSPSGDKVTAIGSQAFYNSTDFKTAYTKADLAEGKLFRKGKKTFVKVIAE